jgi:hypothetical protein
MRFRHRTILLSEKIFESLASIQRSAGRSLALDGGSRRVEVALIAGFLFGDAGTHGLGAFEAACGIKKRTLLATMQLGITAWTLPGEVNSIRQNSCASRASHHFALAGHVGCLRAKAFDFLRGLALSSLASAS